MSVTIDITAGNFELRPLTYDKRPDGPWLRWTEGMICEEAPYYEVRCFYMCNGQMLGQFGAIVDGMGRAA